MTHDILVTAISRRGERYVFFYEENRLADVLIQIARWVRDPELSFDKLDATRVRCAVMSQVGERA